MKQKGNWQIWQMRSVNVVPVVIGALGSVTKTFEKWLEKIQVEENISLVQKNSVNP